MNENSVLYGTDENLVFKEAAAFLKKRNVVLSDDYKKMLKESKMLSFTVGGFTNIEILKAFQEELITAIETGTTKEVFQEKMNTFLTDQGYIGLNPHKADVIFRTNIQTAFNAGHYKSMSDPTTKKLRPYWKYVTAGDNHVRDDHAMMNNRIYAADNPIWDIWYPPNGYRCRCSVISLTKNQFEKEGGKIDKGLQYIKVPGMDQPKPIFPDKGFNMNPAKKIWEPDLTGYPENLKKTFRERNNSFQ